MISATIQAILSGPRWRRSAPFGLIRVLGEGARDFLHRLSTQDIVGMAEAEVRPAAFLDGKGRLCFVCQVASAGEDLYLSVPAEQLTALAEMLDRYHFVEPLRIEVAEGLVCAEGVSLRPLDDLPAGGVRVLEDGGVAIGITRGGVCRNRYHATAVPDHTMEGDALTPGEEDFLRIAIGEIAVGVDSEPTTLAMELPIADHIALDKGCYTGQEIVARIHTYGHTNRSLCRVEIAGIGAVAASTPLVDEDGDPVGRVMSVADVPEHDGRVGFGFLPSLLCDPGTELALASAEGPRVVVLPPLS